MTVKEVKKWIVEQIKEELHYIKSFEGDDNPQIKKMYFEAKGKIDILDDLHFKLFHKYYKI